MTTTLPNGVQIPDDDVFIWEVYNFKCVAHPFTWAVCLHEEPPKSLNPHWKSMPETRYPVCDQCHQLVHRIQRIDAAFFLEHARTENWPNAVKEIIKHVTKQNS